MTVETAETVEKNVLKKVERSPVSIIQSEATSIDIKNYKVKSVLLRSGEKINCSCLIITAGTFLSGLIHIGERKILAGRMGEERSEGITESLESFGFFSGRLKTGTPARLLKNTINYENLEEQLGDKNPEPFSYMSSHITNEQVSCHITRTTKETHKIIKDNISKSAMYSGLISGVGPRYCPSIEDKVERFAEKNSHQIFLEPEGLDSNLVYPNGISTSLPEAI